MIFQHDLNATWSEVFPSLALELSRDSDWLIFDSSIPGGEGDIIPARSGDYRMLVDAPTIMEIKATIPMTISRYTVTGTESFKAIYEPIGHSPSDLGKDFQVTGCKDTHDTAHSLLSFSRERVNISIDHECSVEDLLANSFIKLGWSEPEHVKAVAKELEFAETVLSSCGGPNVASN